MKLYTINATCVQASAPLIINNENILNYESRVAEILADYSIDGFTMYQVRGYWQGEAEKSWKIEIASDNWLDINRACKALRDEYKQDAVMLTNPDNTVEFI